MGFAIVLGAFKGAVSLIVACIVLAFIAPHTAALVFVPLLVVSVVGGAICGGYLKSTGRPDYLGSAAWTAVLAAMGTAVTCAAGLSLSFAFSADFAKVHGAQFGAVVFVIWIGIALQTLRMGHYSLVMYFVGYAAVGMAAGAIGGAIIIGLIIYFTTSSSNSAAIGAGLGAGIGLIWAGVKAPDQVKFQAYFQRHLDQLGAQAGQQDESNSAKQALENPRLSNDDPKQIAYALLSTAAISLVVRGDPDITACFQALKVLEPVFETAEPHSRWLGSFHGEDGVYWVALNGPAGSAIAILYGESGDQDFFNTLAMPLRDLPAPWKWEVVTPTEGASKDFGDIFSSAAVVPIAVLTDREHQAETTSGIGQWARREAPATAALSTPIPVRPATTAGSRAAAPGKAEPLPPATKRFLWIFAAAVICLLVLVGVAILNAHSKHGGNSATTSGTTWVGVDSAGENVKLKLRSSDTLDGTITFTAANNSSCTESWTEKTRDNGTISVQEEYVSGDMPCINALWQVVMDGNTLFGRTTVFFVNAQYENAQYDYTMTLHRAD
jgi:hypothetical protein